MKPGYSEYLFSVSISCFSYEKWFDYGGETGIDSWSRHFLLSSDWRLSEVCVWHVYKWNKAENNGIVLYDVETIPESRFPGIIRLVFLKERV